MFSVLVVIISIKFSCKVEQYCCGVFQTIKLQSGELNSCTVLIQFANISESQQSISHFRCLHLTPVINNALYLFIGPSVAYMYVQCMSAITGMYIKPSSIGQCLNCRGVTIFLTSLALSNYVLGCQLYTTLCPENITPLGIVQWKCQI